MAWRRLLAACPGHCELGTHSPVNAKVETRVYPRIQPPQTSKPQECICPSVLTSRGNCASLGLTWRKRREAPLHSQAGRAGRCPYSRMGVLCCPLAAAVRKTPCGATSLTWEDFLLALHHFAHILTKPHPLHQHLRAAPWGQRCGGGALVIGLHPAAPSYCSQSAPSELLL